MAAAPAASATIILGDPPANEDVASKADGAPEPSAAPGQRSSTPIRPSSHDVTDGPDGVSIHTTDGRVKNPVPSKLKGKADNKNGNFGVMHIDINSSQAALRNAAAKRTSEETEAAARLANMRGYQSIKRSKLAWNPQSESDPRSSAPAYGASQNGHLNSSYSLPGRPLGPLPHEAKAEQARLLTLLRTLNPMVVVDQLCKALAYFGGIPGAPSSHEFDFPDSGRNNGQGSIFVGWVAEIFPPVEGNPSALAPHPSLQSADIASAAAPTAVVAADASAPASAQAPALSDSANTAALPTQPASTASLSEPAPNPPDGQNATGEAITTPIKRPRGRPKGSKSSKPRIDKGMKKSDLALLSSSQQVDGTGSQLSQSDLGRRPDGSYDQSQNGLANPAYHGDNMPGHLDPDSSIMSTPGTGKKRGRPKGSKNRPKNTPEAGGQAAVENPHALLPASSTSNPITLSPLSHKATESQNSISSFANTMPPRSEQHQHPSPTLPESVATQHAAHMASRAPQGSQPAYPAASSWAGVAMQSLDQFRSINNHSHSKKRKGGGDAAQVARESLATIAAADPSSHMRQGDDTPLHGITSDQTNIKRRRVSRESHQNPIFNSIDSQPGRVGMTTSPVLNNNYNSISQTMASNSFDTQLANASAAVRQVSNQQHLQQQQQQQQHHHHHSQRSPTQPQGQTQPQPQQYAPQRPHPQSAGMRPPLQLGHLPPGSSRPRAPSQLYGSSPTSISPQGFYNQARQLPGQLGHAAATNSGSFARGTGNNSQQPSPFGSSSSNMARQSSGDARTASLSQQASLAISRSQSGHTPTARHASSDFASSQQVPATSASAAPSTSGLGHFPAFAEHSYLDMDYGLNERDVQDSAAAFGDSTPIDVTLVEPNIRERLYQAMSRP